MLGVATLIVVNSVMEGFSSKLKDRMLGIQADVLIEARSHDGFPDYARMMRRVQELVGDKIQAMSPVIEAVAMLHFRPRFTRSDGSVVYGEVMTRPVQVLGIDPISQAQVGQFGQHLLNPKNRARPEDCFRLDGFIPPARTTSSDFGIEKTESDAEPLPENRMPKPMAVPAPEPPPPVETPVFAAVVGYGIASYRNPDAKVDDSNKDVFILQPGDEIVLLTGSKSELDGYDGRKGYARPVPFRCIVTDLFKCDMSEFDSKLIYMSLRDLENLRTMHGRATCLQIKLKDYDRDKQSVVESLAAEYPYYLVQTWEHKQGPVLAAISIERGILNVLLFLIICVAGFGILAIFFMTVVEKTRDIGILKALGASNAGVMGIFIAYALALGLIGTGLGTALGISITVYINEIEQVIAHVTGQEVFPRQVYYFDKIPTSMQPLSILFVNLGAVAIAVGASVFPSFKAALLHPVRALRYE
jgi:lipoprotein-releasing system permease protein